MRAFSFVPSRQRSMPTWEPPAGTTAARFDLDNPAPRSGGGRELGAETRPIPGERRPHPGLSALLRRDRGSRAGLADVPPQSFQRRGVWTIALDSHASITPF